MKLLSRSEELILLAIWKLQDDAYGVTIRRQLREVTGRSWSIGAVYVPLEKLSRYGLIRSRQAPPTDSRGGRSKRYYRLTPRGMMALNEVRRIHEVMWSDLPHFVPQSL